jgi:hypothetical protein
MPKLTINETSLKSIKPPAPDALTKSGNAKADEFYWDTSLEGFGVRVKRDGSKHFVIQRKLPGIGKSVRETLGTWAGSAGGTLTLTQARDRATALIGDIRKGINPVEVARQTAEAGKPKSWQTLTLMQAFDEFTAGKQHSEQTARQYRKDVMGRMLKPWQDRRLLDIKRADCEAQHKAIRDEIRAGKCKRLGVAELPKLDSAGNSGANLAMKVLEAVWSYIEAKYRDQSFPQGMNPVTGFERFYVPVRKSKVSNSGLPAWWAETETLFKDDPIQRDTFRLMLFTALRNEDCCSIRWGDIDFDHAKIFRPDPKGGPTAAFDAPLSNAALAILRGRQRDNAKDFGADDGGYVFPIRKSNGAIGCRDQIRKPDNAKVITIPHDLRRTWKNAARNAEVERDVRTRLMNHRDGNSTGSVHEDYTVFEWSELADGTQRTTDYLLSKIGVAVADGAFVKADIKPTQQTPAPTPDDDPAELLKQMAALQAKLAASMSKGKGAA